MDRAAARNQLRQLRPEDRFGAGDDVVRNADGGYPVEAAVVITKEAAEFRVAVAQRTCEHGIVDRLQAPQRA